MKKKESRKAKRPPKLKDLPARALRGPKGGDVKGGATSGGGKLTFGAPRPV